MSRVTTGAALLVLVAVAVAARGALVEVIVREGAPAAQRPLAGGTAGRNAPVDRPLRVIVIDGLARADVARMPALADLCARGLALDVDVGFPTKSLPVQATLWTGLTSQQRGDRADNLERAWPSAAVPALVPGSVAVAESHAGIARSLGFGRVEVPARDELAAVAAREVASPAPLVLVHVLAVDEAAHAAGRRGLAYGAALARADRVLAAVVAAAPDAQWLALSDHGHVAGGGHGDAEDEVRIVRACWSPPVAGVAAPATTHAIDVARWIADAVGAPRDARARGRTLATAAAHPDPGATLPRPAPAALVAGALLALAGLGAAWAVTPCIARCRRLVVLWPLAAALALLVVDGVPTWSARPSPGLLALLGGCGGAVAASALRGVHAARLTVASLAGVVGVVLGLAVVTGLPQALLGGPPPTVPWWTGFLAATTPVAVSAAAAVGLTLVVDGIYANLRRRP